MKIMAQFGVLSIVEISRYRPSKYFFMYSSFSVILMYSIYLGKLQHDHQPKAYCNILEALTKFPLTVLHVTAGDVPTHHKKPARSILNRVLIFEKT